tara:strand:+ start:43 stop:408 length:366 start_codon:yes stop_codon:yes gene_type:complete
MTNPNIVNVTSITGEVDQFALTTTLSTVLVTAAAEKIYKINSINVANIDGTSDAAVTLGLIKSGGAQVDFASTITVPADATLVVIDKNNGFYLEEGDAIVGGASADGDLTATISYEVIDDA